MAYTAWSVTAGEVPTAAKWNILGQNDADFNSGVGLAFTANNVVPANALATNAIALAYAEVSSNQGSISTETDLTGLSATVTVPGGNRKIRITGSINLYSGSAEHYGILRIKEGGTVLKARQGLAGIATSTHLLCQYISPTAPSSGSHTYKLSLTRIAGSTVTLLSEASVGYEPFIFVELI